MLKYDAATGKYSASGADLEKYGTQLQGYYGRQELAKAGIKAGGEHSSTYETLKGLGQLISEIQKTVDQTKKDTSTEGGPLAGLKEAIEKGTTDLGTAISNLTTQLSGLTNVGG
jgi:hypothetical protein